LLAAESDSNAPVTPPLGGWVDLAFALGGRTGRCSRGTGVEELAGAASAALAGNGLAAGELVHGGLVDGGLVDGRLADRGLADGGLVDGRLADGGLVAVAGVVDAFAGERFGPCDPFTPR